MTTYDQLIVLQFHPSEGSRFSDKINTVLSHSPSGYTYDIKQLIKFCFPEEKQLSTPPRDHFVFVMTHADGERVYGFCRRHGLPDHAMECVCVLSRSVQDYVWLWHYVSLIDVRLLLCPDAIPPMILSSTVAPITLHSEGSHRVPIASLLTALSSNNLSWVLVALLCERRVIIVSERLPLLSSCIHAIVSLLYPFQWQHIYIPILPYSLLHCTCAPMPFLIGAQAHLLPSILGLPLEEVCIVDLDANSIRITSSSTPFPTSISVRLAKLLPNLSSKRHRLKNKGTIAISRLIKSSHMSSLPIPDEVLVYDTIMSYYVMIMGHWIECMAGGKIQLEKFLGNTDSQDHLVFLQGLTQSQLFQQFIQSHSPKNWSVFAHCCNGDRESLNSILQTLRCFQGKCDSVRDIATLVLQVTSNDDAQDPLVLTRKIIDSSYHSSNAQLIISLVCWRLSKCSGKQWKHAYKSMVLLYRMCSHASDIAVALIRDSLSIISHLQEYSHKELQIQAHVRRHAGKLVGCLLDVRILRGMRTDLYESMPQLPMSTLTDGFVDPLLTPSQGKRFTTTQLQELRQASVDLAIKNAPVIDMDEFKKIFARYHKYRKRSVLNEAPLFPDFIAMHRSFVPPVTTNSADILGLIDIIPSEVIDDSSDDEEEQEESEDDEFDILNFLTPSTPNSKSNADQGIEDILEFYCTTRRP